MNYFTRYQSVFLHLRRKTVFLPVFADRFARKFLKADGEIIRVLDTDGGGDLIGFLLCFTRQLHGFLHPDLIEEFRKMLSGLLLEDPAQIAGVEIELLCDACQRQLWVSIVFPDILLNFRKTLLATAAFA